MVKGLLFRYRIWIFATGFMVCGGALLLLLQFFYSTGRASQQVFIHDTAHIAPGYVLVSATNAQYGKQGEVRLIDADGHVVHTWQTRYQTLEAIVEENGNLMAAMTPPINPSDYPSNGTTGILQELDWDGKVLWEYRDNRMTHDFDVLPDGSVAYTRWALAPQWFAQSVQGGMEVATSSVWTNEIVVVNKEKKITWTWAAHDHLNPARYPVNNSVPRSDWSHLNSLRYIGDNPLTHVPAFLISIRDISTVFIIDAKTGGVIWQSPEDMFSLQHDATLLQNGHILVFDNGLFRPKGPPILLSRVVEVDPNTNAIVWTYDGGTGGQVGFATSIAGGAQRLLNGNTLITVSTTGRIYEVREDGTIVWEYVSDFRNDEGAARMVFKARKYSGEGTTWGPLITNLMPSWQR